MNTDPSLALLDEAPVPLLLARQADGLLLFANRSCRELCGATAAAGFGAAGDLFDSPAAWDELRARVADNGAVQEVEVRLRGPTDRRVCGILRGRAYRYGDEDAVFASLVDLTTHRDSVEALERHEEDRRDREWAFSRLMEIGGVGTWTRDIRTGELNWSAGTGRIWGFGPEMVHPTYAMLAERVHPDDRQAFQDLRAKATREGGRFEDAVRLVWPDGSVRHVRTVGEVVTDDAGQPVRMFGMTQDLTERVRAEERERGMRQLLQAVFDAFPNHLHVKGLDLRYRIVNQGFARDAGCAPEDMVGRSIEDLAFLTAEERQELTRQERTVLESGAPLTLTAFPYAKPDGRQVFETTVKYPFRDEAGQIAGIVTYTLDVTDTVRAQRALRDSEERFRAIVENLPYSYAIVDHYDGHLVFANEALRREFGIQDALEGHHAQEFYANPADREGVLAAYARTGQYGPKELEFRMGDGTVRWVLASGKVITFDGRPSYLFTWVDVDDLRRTEEDLRANRLLLEQIIDAIPMWVFAKDTHSNYVMVNKAMADFFQMDKAEFIGSNTARLPTPDRTRQKSLDDDRWVFEHRISLEQPEVMLERPDGTPVAFQSHKIPLFDRSGMLTGLLGVNRDITAEKQALEERETHRRLLQAVLEALPAPIFLKGANGRYEMLNTALAEFYGTTVDALVGRHLSELPFIDDEERDRLLAEDASVIATGEAFESPAIERAAADGSRRTFQVMKAPLFDAQGNVTHIVGHATDITEIRDAERVFRESAQILQQINDAVVVVDLEDRIVRWSPGAERMYGYAAEEVLGQPISRLWPGDVDGEGSQQALYRDILTGEGRSSIVERETKDGRRVFVSVSLSRLSDEGGTPYAIVGTSHDVTDIVNAERSLRKGRALLRSVIDAIPSRIVVRGVDGTKLLANRAMGATIGCTPDEFVAHPAKYPALTPREAELAAAKDRIVLGEARPVEYEREKRLPDGTVEWSYVHKVPLWDETGSLAGVVTVDEVTTARKLAELAVSESERRYRDLVDGSIQGVLIHQNYQIQFVSQRLAEMLGYASAAELGRVTNAWDLLAPASYSAMQAVAEQRERGLPVAPMMEIQMLRKDGSAIWVERRLREVQWEGAPALQVVIHDIHDRKLAEERLKESEQSAKQAYESLRFAVDSAPAGLALYDRDDRLVICNDEFRSYFPHDRAAIQPGTSFAEIVRRFVDTGGLKAPVRVGEEWLADRVAAHRNPQAPMQLHLADGRRLQVREIAAAAGGISSVYVDITELVNTQEALRSLNAELEVRVASRTRELAAERNFINTVLDTQEALVVLHDREGRVVRFNSACQRLTGLTNAHVMHREIWDEVVAADEVAAVRKLFKDVVAGEFPTHFENHWIRSDGSRIPIAWSNSAILDESGEVAFVVATGIDITERKRSEEQLARTRARLEFLIGSSPAVIYAGAGEPFGALSYISSSVRNLLGYDPEALRSDPSFLPEHVHPADLPDVMEKTRQLATSDRLESEYRLRHKSGEYRWIRDYRRVVRDAQGRHREVVGIWLDVTDRVRAQQQLDAMRDRMLADQKMVTLGQLTATVSHELRNPLGAISTTVFSLEQSLDDKSEPVQRALERIGRNVVRCDNIITDLLDFSRIRPSHAEPTQYDRWLREVVEELPRPDWVQVEYVLQTEDLVVELDQDRIRRVIINLAENAIQAIEQSQESTEQRSGLMRVSTCVAGDRLQTRISDTGPGMTPEVLERIFEPLFSTKVYGIGLGLPTVKQLLEQEGGSIEFKSQPGVGTVVCVELPMTAQ